MVFRLRRQIVSLLGCIVLGVHYNSQATEVESAIGSYTGAKGRSSIPQSSENMCLCIRACQLFFGAERVHNFLRFSKGLVGLA